MIATCHTPGCVNKGIHVDVGQAGVVICGPCSQPAEVAATTPKPAKKAATVKEKP